ncbi:MAG: MMPL family transporter [Acidobacteriota bacterium]
MSADTQSSSAHPISSFFESLLRWRLIALGLVLLGTIAAGSQLPKLQIDNSNEAFFMTGDPTKEYLDQFHETFGSDDFAFILVETDDVFEPSTLQRLGELADRLENEVPHLLDLTWVGNVEWIEGVPGGIVIDDLVPDLNASRETLDALGARASQDPLYRDNLISGDRRTAGLLMEFENYPDVGIDPRKDSPPVIDAIVQDFPDLETYVVGSPVADFVMDDLTAKEAPLWLAVALFGMALALALTTRSVIGVLVPAATVILSVMWTMGIVATLGYKLNLLVILVPTLLLCVGIGDSMHVVAEFVQLRGEGRTRRDALLHSLGLVSAPIFLTTVTTAAGFLAFMTTDLVPLRELGIQAAVGVVIALLLTYLFAVPVLSFGRDAAPAVSETESTDLFDRFLASIGQFVIRNRTAIGLAFAALFVFSVAGLARLEIDTNTVKAMAEDEPLRMAFEYVDERMGGSMSIELVVDSGTEDGIKDLELLRSVARLHDFLDQHPLVTQTSSVVDQIKQMQRAVHENRPDEHRLPDTESQVAEYLLLYESGGGRQLDKFVSFTYDQLRLSARTRSIAFGEVRELKQDLDQFVSDEFPEGVGVYTTGALPMMQRLGDLLAESQAKSFAFAFCAIALLLSLSLRSVRLGLIAMIPNVLPVVIAMGVMGWVGAEFNMVFLVLAPMILGVAVDDTVHFFTRYRRHFEEHGDYDRAHLETLRTVGRPLLFTTVVLVFGFSGFAFSAFDGPRDFSMACFVAFTSALAAEFFLAPVLLYWLKPLGAPSTLTTTAAAA